MRDSSLEARIIKLLYNHSKLERRDFSQYKWKQISATLGKLERLYVEPERSTTTEDLLMIKCCAMFGIPVSEFHILKRKREVLDARAIFCKILFVKNYDVPVIAGLIRKNRTNVYNCLKTADSILINRKREQEYKQILETIKL